MAVTPAPVGLYYDESVYAERAVGPRSAGVVSPVGPSGRPVAGRGFLDAYLSHGAADGLVAFVSSAAAGKAAAGYCQSHPVTAFKGRRVEVVEEQAFHARVFPEPPATLIHFPHPPEVRYAWARQHGGPGAFALSGVTQGLASAGGAEAVCALVTAPFEPYDALVCTSRAAAAVVRATAGAYADYLRDRHGGDPGLRVRLEVIPPGVDAERFGPPSPAERAASRQALGVADDEVMVLFLGRLSHHGKAHPYPLFDGVARAARAAGRKVHLVLAGWAVSEAIARAFRDGARVFAPGVRVSLVDGTGPPHRFGAWHAADLFATFADNVQETFGLAVLEAMASGLPVVASDWDGNRDQVVDGETGLLVPSYMVRGATADATSRLVVREVNYDFFLAECNQTVAVDPAAVAVALGRLIADDGLRQRLGAAGRARALERFAWPAVIRAYERLWEGQEEERRAASARGQERRPHPGPACYPAPEHTYAAYPTALLGDDDRVVADEDARERLTWLLGLPLTNYVAERRSADPEVLRSVLAAAASPRTLAELDGVLAGAGVRRVPGRATLAWMLKYGLLRPASDLPGADRGDDRAAT